MGKNDFVYIMMELCQDNLNVILEQNFEEQTKLISNIYIVNYKIAFNIFNQVLSAVHYLHDRNEPIIHRDIKPNNVLIKLEEDQIIFKLCDFGLSKIYIGQKNTQYCGTKYYMAPEVENGTDNNEKCDIFSLAKLGMELFIINQDDLLV